MDVGTRKRFSNEALTMAFVSLLLFAALSLLLVYDPVISAAADPANLGKDQGGWWAEDNIVEYLSAAFPMIAAGAWLWAIRQARSGGILAEGRDYVFAFALVAAMVILAGEEISWGQRLFGFDTPEYLEKANIQKEVNFHNLEGPVNIIILLYLGTLCWGVVFPVLRRASRIARGLFWRFRLPVPPLHCAPLFLIAPVFRVVYISHFGNYAREGMELIFAVAFVVVAILAAANPSAVWVRPDGREAD